MDRGFFIATAGAGLALLAVPSPAVAADANAGNAALLDGYVAAFNAHDVSAFANVIAENYIQHNGRAGQGLTGIQTVMRGYFQTFPDFHMQVEDRIFGGDRVVTRSTLTATHVQPVQLAPGAAVFAPTGRKLSWAGIDIWRVAGGKFAEHWDENDFVDLSRQLRGE